MCGYLTMFAIIGHVIACIDEEDDLCCVWANRIDVTFDLSSCMCVCVCVCLALQVQL